MWVAEGHRKENAGPFRFRCYFKRWGRAIKNTGVSSCLESDFILARPPNGTKVYSRHLKELYIHDVVRGRANKWRQQLQQNNPTPKTTTTTNKQKSTITTTKRKEKRTNIYIFKHAVVFYFLFLLLSLFLTLLSPNTASKNKQTKNNKIGCRKVCTRWVHRQRIIYVCGWVLHILTPQN